MAQAPRTIARLEALLGAPSPEDHGFSACTSCGEDTRFVGIDDLGFPGDGARCSRCDRPAKGDDGERCECPAYTTLTQPFAVDPGTGEVAEYMIFEGGSSGAEISFYTRIYCAGCGDLVWVDDLGVAAAVEGWLRNDETTDVDGLTRLALERDFRGVLDRVDTQPDNILSQAALACPDSLWQAGFDRHVENNVQGACSLYAFSDALRSRTSVDAAVVSGRLHSLIEKGSLREAFRAWSLLPEDERPALDRARIEKGIRSLASPKPEHILHFYRAFPAAKAFPMPSEIFLPLLNASDGKVRQEAFLLVGEIPPYQATGRDKPSPSADR